MSWSSDGAHLAFDERKPNAERDVWTLTRGGDPSPFLMTAADESAPAFSPGGGWLAYVSDEVGRREVYVQPFPGPGRKWTISSGGGTEPVWSRDGKELYYRRGDQFVSVTISAGTDFQIGKPQTLFQSRYETIEGARNYDVSSGSFVVVRSEGAVAYDQFNVVLNWFAEFRARR
jgi:Tol biopolymer transport system component